MPKIPLYAEGAGSLVKSPVGQTGPRASVAAFTAPSQALIGLGQQVGKAGLAYAEGKQRFEAQKSKIDFDFAMAEKQAEDNRIVSEEADAAVIATSAFLCTSFRSLFCSSVTSVIRIRPTASKVLFSGSRCCTSIWSRLVMETDSSVNPLDIKSSMHVS